MWRFTYKRFRRLYITFGTKKFQGLSVIYYPKVTQRFGKCFCFGPRAERWEGTSGGTVKNLISVIEPMHLKTETGPDMFLPYSEISIQYFDTPLQYHGVSLWYPAITFHLPNMSVHCSYIPTQCSSTWGQAQEIVARLMLWLKLKLLVQKVWVQHWIEPFRDGSNFSLYLIRIHYIQKYRVKITSLNQVCILIMCSFLAYFPYF
jgi:hypothetical protein